MTSVYCIRNAHKTPDGTIIESNHVHDYQTHVDSITGETYMCDGLGWYIRTSINKVPMQSLCVTTEDDFEIQRKYFKWKTYGEENQYAPYGIYVILQDMQTEHIKNILRSQHHIVDTYVEELFLKELSYRNLNKD